MPKNIVAREADKPTAVEFINSLKLVYKFKLDSDKYQIINCIAGRQKTIINTVRHKKKIAILMNILESNFWNFSPVFVARLEDSFPKYFETNTIIKTNIKRYPASLAAEK